MIKDHTVVPQNTQPSQQTSWQQTLTHLSHVTLKYFSYGLPLSGVHILFEYSDQSTEVKTTQKYLFASPVISQIWVWYRAQKRSQLHKTQKV